MKQSIQKYSLNLMLSFILIAVFVNAQDYKRPLETGCYPITERSINSGEKIPMGFTEVKKRLDNIADAHFRLVDTPKVKPIRFQVGERQQPQHRLQIIPTGFFITDSSRIVAERDTSGNWKIIDPKRALEVAYQAFTGKKKDDPTQADRKEEIKHGSIWESNYGNTYIYDAKFNRVADRNSFGEWEIMDAASALEILYRIVIKYNKLPKN